MPCSGRLVAGEKGVHDWVGTAPIAMPVRIVQGMTFVSRWGGRDGPSFQITFFRGLGVGCMCTT